MVRKVAIAGSTLGARLRIGRLSPPPPACRRGHVQDGRVPNIYEPEFDEPREREGFRARRARVGHQLGKEKVGISVWEIPAGEKAYPYHFHLTGRRLARRGCRLGAYSPAAPASRTQFGRTYASRNPARRMLR